MIQPLNIASYTAVLDLRATRTLTLVDLSERINTGLSLASLQHAQAVIAPGDRGFRDRIVAPSSYKRRRGRNRLSSAESQRLSRVARIWAAGIDVYDDEDQVRRFIGKPHPLLNNRPPIDLATESDEGCQAVEEVLLGLKYGTAA